MEMYDTEIYAIIKSTATLSLKAFKVGMRPV